MLYLNLMSIALADTQQCALYPNLHRVAERCCAQHRGTSTGNNPHLVKAAKGFTFPGKACDSALGMLLEFRKGHGRLPIFGVSGQNANGGLHRCF